MKIFLLLPSMVESTKIQNSWSSPMTLFSICSGFQTKLIPLDVLLMVSEQKLLPYLPSCGLPNNFKEPFCASFGLKTKNLIIVSSL
jgi:hypothetical protein